MMWSSVQPLGESQEVIGQSRPLDNRQVLGKASGYVYQVDNFTRLLRFLILGSEGGTYYSQSKELQRENITCIDRYGNIIIALITV